jgi:hypothetical protein
MRTRIESTHNGKPRSFTHAVNESVTLTSFVYNHDGSGFMTDIGNATAGVAPSMTREQYMSLFEDIDECHNNDTGHPLLGLTLVAGGRMWFESLENMSVHVYHTMLHVLSRAVDNSRTPMFMGSMVEVMRYDGKHSVSAIEDITISSVFYGGDHLGYRTAEDSKSSLLTQLFQARDRAVEDIGKLTSEEFPAPSFDKVELRCGDTQHLGNGELVVYMSLGFLISPGANVHAITGHTSGAVNASIVKPGYTGLTVTNGSSISVPTSLVRCDDNAVRLYRLASRRSVEPIIPDYTNFPKTNSKVWSAAGDATVFRSVTSVYHGGFTFDHKNYFEVPPNIVITIPTFPSTTLSTDAYRFSEEIMNVVRRGGAADIARFVRATASRETPMTMNDTYINPASGLAVGDNKDSQMPLSSFAVFVENMNDRPELENFEVCTSSRRKSILRYRTYFPGMMAPNITYRTEETDGFLRRMYGYTGVRADPETAKSYMLPFPHTIVTATPGKIRGSAETRTTLAKIATILSVSPGHTWLTANSCYSSVMRRTAVQEVVSTPAAAPVNVVTSFFFEAGLHNIARKKISFLVLTALDVPTKHKIVAAIAGRLVSGASDFATMEAYDNAIAMITVDDCGSTMALSQPGQTSKIRRELLPPRSGFSKFFSFGK